MKTLTDQINKIREEIAPQATPPEVREKLIDRLTDLIEMNESVGGTRPNLSGAIVTIGSQVVTQVNNREVRDALDEALVNVLYTVIGVDPDDEDDSVPPLECAFYGEGFEDLN